MSRTQTKKDNYIKNFLLTALEDLRSAHLLYKNAVEEGSFLFNNSAYHVSQAVEKTLKAVFISITL